jgi:hypothetical protein
MKQQHKYAEALAVIQSELGNHYQIEHQKLTETAMLLRKVEKDAEAQAIYKKLLDEIKFALLVRARYVGANPYSTALMSGHGIWDILTACSSSSLPFPTRPSPKQSLGCSRFRKRLLLINPSIADPS